MSILEIVWVVLNILGVFYSVRFFKECSDFTVPLFTITFWSTLLMLGNFVFKYIDFLTTPLW